MVENFLSVFRGGVPDLPVWTADISYWISGRQQEGSADPAWETEEGYLQLHQDLGIMPYYYYDKFWTAEPEYEDTITVSSGKEDGRDFQKITTPMGALRQESVYLPESACHGITKYMVQDEAELDVLLYLLQHRRLKPCNLDDYRERQVMWKKYGGLPCLGLPRSPLSALAYEWCGLEGLVMLLLDCEYRVREALSLLEQQEKPVIDAVCALAPPLVHFPDNLSSENLTGYYDEYMLRHHGNRITRLHSAGIKTAVHLDGTVRGLLPKLADAGFDSVEALTPQPAGDVPVEEMVELVGTRGTILWGGVPGAMFAPPYSWEDMEGHVNHVLSVWKDRPFVLGVADQVPPDGDIGYCRRIHELIGG